jgi:hypothetical protein
MGMVVGMERVILLNNFPLNAFEKAFFNQYMTVQFKQISAKEFSETINFFIKSNYKVENYIKYADIVMLINKLANLELQPNDGAYKYNAGDVVFIFATKKKADGDEMTEEDVSIYKATVAPGAWL